MTELLTAGQVPVTDKQILRWITTPDGKNVNECLKEALTPDFLSSLSFRFQKIKEEFDSPLEGEMRDQLYLHTFKEAFPVINPEFLSVHQQALRGSLEGDSEDSIEGWEIPDFAVYHPDGRQSSFLFDNIHRNHKVQIAQGDLVGILAEHFLRGITYEGSGEEFGKTMGKITHHRGVFYQVGKIEGRSTFKGNIPRQVKTLLNLCREPLDDNVYVVAQGEWEISVHIASFPSRGSRDPLVVGVKGKDCFLLAAYDCTPLEAVVKDQYARIPRRGQ